MKILHNKELTIKINSLGAELCSIRKNNSNQEYIWQANPNFWKRHSPVLFPIVGSLWEGKYNHEGKQYNMEQHGFARDLKFNLLSSSSQEIVYQLENNQKTILNYPFYFRLKISYKLEQNFVQVYWEVENTGDQIMHFQIGAHPAFNYFYPLDDLKGYLNFYSDKDLYYMLIKEKGCVETQNIYSLALEERLLPITPSLFNKDALIFENENISRVDLLTPDKKTYICVHFDSPLIGIWSPVGKKSPFICIEPWYGRCDRVNYIGEFKDRDWMNHLPPKDIFTASYSIEIV